MGISRPTEAIPNNQTGITTLLVFIFIFIVYKYTTRYHGYWKKRGVPYVEPNFLPGSLWAVFTGKEQLGKFLGVLHKSFSTPYFGIYIMGKPFLVIRSPGLLKRIAIRDFSQFDSRTIACDKEADHLMGNSLVSMKNPEWKTLRHKISPIFTSGKLKLMLPIVRKCCEEMQRYVEISRGTSVDVKTVSEKYMTDVVASAVFGFDTHSFRGETEFHKNGKKLFSVGMYRAFCIFCFFFVPKLVTWFRLKIADAGYLECVFLRAIEERERLQVKRNDFIDLLLQVKRDFDENEQNFKFDSHCMVAQALTFYVASYETTSNILAFALYELCLHVGCQEKLRTEIEEVLHGNGEITFENIEKMAYLDMVISETLRRYPFALFLNRDCREDYEIKETGLLIEKGTPILVSIDGIHYDPEYYDEPENFDPERFANGNRSKFSQACTFIPFGVGPRSCIGDRFAILCTKVGLIHFLRYFKVRSSNETPIPLVLNTRSPFVKPMDGLKMLVEKVT